MRYSFLLLILFFVGLQSSAQTPEIKPQKIVFVQEKTQISQDPITELLIQKLQFNFLSYDISDISDVVQTIDSLTKNKKSHYIRNIELKYDSTNLYNVDYSRTKKLYDCDSKTVTQKKLKQVCIFKSELPDDKGLYTLNIYSVEQ